MASIHTSSKPSGFLDKVNSAPWIGIGAFFVVFVVQAIGHLIMVVMEEIWPGPGFVYQSAAFMGLAGCVLWYIGLNGKGETAQTWLGFWAGSLVWTGWVEFSFVYYADFLAVPDLLDEAGEIATKNEYMVMMSSLGVMMATLVFFFFNRDTRCNMFRWFHRWLRMDVGKPAPGVNRNYCNITAIETIYIIWFFYLALLLIYDPQILGETHPVVYGLFVANTAWALYLILRLVRFTRMSAAIRYAIPTAIIAWNSNELMGRWDMYTEIWVHPQEYWLEMSLVILAVVLCAGAMMMSPAERRTVDAD